MPTSLWLLLRFLLLNGIVVLLAMVVGLIRNSWEGGDFAMGKEVQLLYIITGSLSNLIYLLDLLFELIYLKMWKKSVPILDFEGKFFRIGVYMAVFLNVFGMVWYMAGILE